MDKFALRNKKLAEFRCRQFRCLTTIVINSDSIDAVRKEGRNLWEEARSKVTMIIVSPEELSVPKLKARSSERQESKK